VRFLVQAAYPGQIFRVEASSDSRYPNLDTQVIVPDGQMAALAICFDSESQGWIPFVMLMALIIATPLSCSKRVKALLIGFLFIQASIAATILVSVAFTLSNRISPTSENLLLLLANRLLVENIWSSFVPPFLFWFTWFAWTENWPLGTLSARRMNIESTQPG
jgi:hypothetical protein